MKQCLKCLSDDVKTVVDQNRIFFQCSTCGSVESRALDKSGQIVSISENGETRHVTVAAMIRQGNKIALVNRRNFPFGLCFPCGHLEYGETPLEAIKREVMEELGLEIKNKKIIFHETILDQCKAGCNLHEWYLYDCKVSGHIVLNTETDGLKWVEINKLENLDIVPQAKTIMSRIGLIKQASDEEIINSETRVINQVNTKNEIESVVKDIPIAIILLDQKSNISYANKSASVLIDNFKENNYFKKFLQSLSVFGKVSIAGKTEIFRKIIFNRMIFNLTFIPFYNQKSLVGVTVTIDNVSDLHKQDKRDMIIYQTSLSLCGSTGSFRVIKTVLKQLITSFDICGIDLMLKDGDTLKTVFNSGQGNNFEKTKIRQKNNENITGLVVRSKHLLAVPDTSKNDQLSGNNKKAFSLLSLPIISNGQVMGVLNIMRPKNVYFEEEEVNMASIIANRIALALENERLYKSLFKQKQSLEKVLSTTTNGFILVDKDYNLIFANDAAIKLLPLKQNDLKNNTVINYLAELSVENSKKLKHFVQESIKQKKRLKAEFISQKGSEKVVVARFNPVIEKNKNCNSVLVGFIDTTRLHNKQKTVEQQVKQLTALFKISSLSINSSSSFFKNVLKKTASILDSERSDLFFFNQSDNLTGLPLNQDAEITNLLSQIKNKFGLQRDFICNNTKNHFKNINQISRIIIAPVLLNGKVIGIQYAINKNKKYNSKDAKWLGIIATRLASRIETTSLFNEIEKDRQQTEKIIDNSGDGIIVRNALDSKTIIWNQAMEQITGYKTSRQWRKTNPQITQFLKDARNEAATNNQDTIYKELKYKNFDGEEQWLGINFSFTKMNGSIDNIIFNVRDISKDKILEDRNKEFVYTTTHELRTPITVIKGYLSMILSGDAGGISPKQKKYFNKVYQSTENLASLVEDLLKTAEIEEDKIVIKKESFDLNVIAGDTINDFGQKAKSKGLKFEEKEFKGNTVVMGDINKTKQALSNLVENAIKYTTKGSVIVKIQKNEKYGKIIVEDTGVGIPKKELESVFSKFYRVPNPESVSAGGTGLGLFIVKNLIEKQGGEVQIESKLGKGTSVSILLPLATK